MSQERGLFLWCLLVSPILVSRAQHLLVFRIHRFNWLESNISLLLGKTCFGKYARTWIKLSDLMSNPQGKQTTMTPFLHLYCVLFKDMTLGEGWRKEENWEKEKGKRKKGQCGGKSERIVSEEYILPQAVSHSFLLLKTHGPLYFLPPPNMTSDSTFVKRVAWYSLKTTNLGYSLDIFEPNSLSNCLWFSHQFFSLATNQTNKIFLLFFLIFSGFKNNGFLKYFIYLFLFIFREGKGGRKRGRETSMCGCLSHAPYWGPGLQCRNVS